MRYLHQPSTVQTYYPFEDMNDFLHGLMLRPSPRRVEAEAPIKIDVSDDDKEYIVMAELPGLHKDNIHVSIEGRQVTISTQVNKEADEKNGHSLLHSERYHGAQLRTFGVTSEIDETRAEAKYEHGILTLTLPKKSDAQTRNIRIT